MEYEWGNDGDTTSSKLVFSLEANEEAKSLSEAISNFVNVDGELIRNVKNEAYLCFFNMTKTSYE